MENEIDMQSLMKQLAERTRRVDDPDQIRNELNKVQLDAEPPQVFPFIPKE